MPHKKKKAFIEKKKAVTFHLVHRSQRDPLVADENAPQHVLLPASKVEVEKRREEQRQYGVFFDDDYDYLQHLKEPSCPTELVSSGSRCGNGKLLITQEGLVEEEAETLPAVSINLPSSVFASEFEEEVGLLNKAAPVSGPRLDMDPDIVAALDDDYDFEDPENALEDDFVIKANDTVDGDHNMGGGGDDEDEWEDTDEEVSDEEGGYGSDGPFSEDEGLPREFLFMKEETRSRFTEYSLTSSVMRRNEQLSLLDDRFEKFYEQFDADEIGALDNTELEGFIDHGSTRIQEVINDYYRQKLKECQKPDELGPRELPVVQEDSEDEQQVEIVVVEEPTEKWDCETILSTYSNLYNRPKLITDPPKSQVNAIHISKKTGIPLGVLPERGPTARQAERMERINQSDLPRASTQPRSREEGREERRARKQAVKEERKERRTEKKANQLAFKQEKARQEKEMLNLRNNVQGLKLS